MSSHEEPWNMRQWAEAHDKADNARFGRINGIFGIALAVLIGLTGWSLKQQYDGMQAQLVALQEAKTSVNATVVASGQQTRAQVQESSKPSRETDHGR